GEERRAGHAPRAPGPLPGPRPDRAARTASNDDDDVPDGAPSADRSASARRHGCRGERPPPHPEGDDPSRPPRRPPMSAPAPPLAPAVRWRHVLATCALGAGLVYLVWRWGFTLGLGSLWLSVPLALAESYGLVMVALLAFSTWRVTDRSAPAPLT